MSPLWRDEVGLYVAPRCIVLSRMRRGLHPVNVAERNCLVESGDTNQWEPALETLEACLEDTTWHEAAGRLIVANHWARYAMVPWSDALSDQEERQDAKRHASPEAGGQTPDPRGDRGGRSGQSSIAIPS